jgi:hypothetical protein
MMEFIRRLPFSRAGSLTNLAWLPIIVQDPKVPGLPNPKWRPTAWLLDTGCSEPGWINNPYALRQFGIDSTRVKELVVTQAKPKLMTLADGNRILTRPARLKLWLQSNLSAFRDSPYPLDFSSTGIYVRDIQNESDDATLSSTPFDDQPFLLGMRHLMLSHIRVYIDPVARYISAWVDSNRWATGCELGLRSVLFNRFYAQGGSCYDVWRAGNVRSIIG